LLDASREHLGHERLLQEGGARLEDSVAHHRVVA
jgi:hypothetical protein